MASQFLPRPDERTPLVPRPGSPSSESSFSYTSSASSSHHSRVESRAADAGSTVDEEARLGSQPASDPDDKPPLSITRIILVLLIGIPSVTYVSPS